MRKYGLFALGVYVGLRIANSTRGTTFLVVTGEKAKQVIDILDKMEESGQDVERLTRVISPRESPE